MTTRFIFLVLPEVHLLDLAGPDQTIHEAIDFGADFEQHYCGLDGAATSSAGLGIRRQQHFSKVKVRMGDHIVIPGARVKYLCSTEFRQQKALFTWLREAHTAGAHLVSICAGALVLAQARLLDGLPCTTHFQITEKLRQIAPRATVKENILFVQHDRIHTSAGIASGIDLMLHIVEQLAGGHLGHKVARELVVYRRRDGVSPQESVYGQFRNHIHSGIHRAQDRIVEHLDDKLSLAELAEAACMSERNFTRTFRKETGTTVGAYINRVRRERIEHLLKNPDLSRKQIARQVGLQSEKQVARILRSRMAGYVR
jgi:transcriptional regulator GlxA family with amidase domain